MMAIQSPEGRMALTLALRGHCPKAVAGTGTNADFWKTIEKANFAVFLHEFTREFKWSVLSRQQKIINAVLGLMQSHEIRREQSIKMWIILSHSESIRTSFQKRAWSTNPYNLLTFLSRFPYRYNRGLWNLSHLAHFWPRQRLRKKRIFYSHMLGQRFI